MWKGEEEKVDQGLFLSSRSALDLSSGRCRNILKGREAIENIRDSRLLLQAEPGDTYHRHESHICFSTMSDLHGTKSTHIATGFLKFMWNMCDYKGAERTGWSE